LFAEGGSYGNAAITITETKTGKSWLLGTRLSGQRIPPYRPSELEIRLIKEKEQRQAILNEAKARRDIVTTCSVRPATLPSKPSRVADRQSVRASPPKMIHP
jgi:hypothetical protein